MQSAFLATPILSLKPGPVVPEQAAAVKPAADRTAPPSFTHLQLDRVQQLGWHGITQKPILVTLDPTFSEVIWGMRVWRRRYAAGRVAPPALLARAGAAPLLPQRRLFWRRCRLGRRPHRAAGGPRA